MKLVEAECFRSYKFIYSRRRSHFLARFELWRGKWEIGARDAAEAVVGEIGRVVVRVRDAQEIVFRVVGSRLESLVAGRKEKIQEPHLSRSARKMGHP